MVVLTVSTVLFLVFQLGCWSGIVEFRPPRFGAWQWESRPIRIRRCAYASKQFGPTLAILDRQSFRRVDIKGYGIVRHNGNAQAFDRIDHGAGATSIRAPNNQ